MSEVLQMMHVVLINFPTAHYSGVTEYFIACMLYVCYNAGEASVEQICSTAPEH